MTELDITNLDITNREFFPKEPLIEISLIPGNPNIKYQFSNKYGTVVVKPLYLGEDFTNLSIVSMQTTDGEMLPYWCVSSFLEKIEEYFTNHIYSEQIYVIGYSDVDSKQVFEDRGYRLVRIVETDSSPYEFEKWLDK